MSARRTFAFVALTAVAGCGARGDLPAPAGIAPRCTAHRTPIACGSDPDCRWLEPGCTDSPAPVEPGCYAPCDDDSACGPGGACAEGSYDPCYQQPCLACGGVLRICL
jgi:hypothetical protein